MVCSATGPTDNTKLSKHQGLSVHRCPAWREAGVYPLAQCAQLDSGSFSLARDSSSASTSGRGKPVRVHAHRKVVKELTDLLLTQELMAHEGTAPNTAAHVTQPCMEGGA